jgi:protease-4
MKRRGLVVLLAILGTIVLVMVVGLVALYVAVSRGPAVPDNATLTLRIGGTLVESAPTDVVSLLTAGRAPTVQGIIDTLRKAKVDDRVRAVLLEPTGFGSPYWGKIQDIRDALLDFKTSGKPLYAYLEYGGDRDYYLATVANRIFLMPSSTLDLTGVATYELFLRGTFDKLGVHPDIHHVGDYKTAANTYTERGFTPEHREMTESLTRDLYDQIIRGVAEGRKKTEEDVRALVDEGPFTPANALRAGLIDEIAYEDEVLEKLGVKPDGSDGGGRRIESDTYSRVSARSLGLDRGPRIAVIHVSGAIVSGASGFDPINGPVVGSHTLIESIRRARRDRSVRAIVLRIDSPGGSATASDVIWRELMIARNERADRPLVASMSDLAASGGYYVALPAKVLVAQASTLTGSIGIFGGKFVTGGLYGKLGANIGSVSYGKHAEMNSPARPYNADETKKLEEQLQTFYDQFVEKVAQSRASTPEQIGQLAKGRVWTGRQAKENGLVDELGGLARAIAVAKELAKIPAADEVELAVYPQPKSIFELLSDSLSGGQQLAITRWASENFSHGEVEALRALRTPLAIFRRGEPLALMPIRFLR